jgi:hypothetical protein
MPSRSSKQNKRGRNSRRNQKGGSDGGVPQISEATLKQAGEIAQKLLGQSMQQGNNAPQTGGSASGAAPQSGVSSSASAPVQNAMVGGALAGAVAGAAVAEAAETKSALNMSPLVGGGRKRGSKRGGKSKRQSESESQSQNQNQNQTGGMVPGLMAAVETALVPLGLYVGQKALQSRRSGKSFARSLNFRKFSRRNRSSRRR